MVYITYLRAPLKLKINSYNHMIAIIARDYPEVNDTIAKICKVVANKSLYSPTVTQSFVVG